ncbi:hypothetical protein G7Y89_g9297 [Cudoniella acicularis]|uniref:RNA ligase domain-containing protein n=1 Tax=Cudoniella acicularis TaxID=354080 RepID=A0A8H4RH87_9HELO|nr:hypothetical protein G7Y89_g9297 [Cudoniella acicularis]
MSLSTINTVPEIEESPTSERPSTLFPKIFKVSDAVEKYKKSKEFESLEEKIEFHSAVIPLVGTVKLHGAHADIVIDRNDDIVLQSRNMVGLTMEKDVYDIAKTLVPLEKRLKALKKRYRERFRTLNPDVEIDEEYPTIIAGEWIGPGVQKNVAISKIADRHFVILSVSINNAWLPDELYANIDLEAAGIYNISRGGFYHEELDLKNIAKSTEILQNHTLEVEKECPFAKTFGISGIGEGIVWKMAHPLGSDARYWFKTKGPLHAVTMTEKLKKDTSGKKNKLAKANEFAQAVVTKNRLQQGWDYMSEMRIRRDMKGIAVYIKWMWEDVNAEEKEEMERLEVDKDILQKKVVWLSKEWYLQKLESPESFAEEMAALKVGKS